jgi:hypothetical protein
MPLGAMSGEVGIPYAACTLCGAYDRCTRFDGGGVRRCRDCISKPLPSSPMTDEKLSKRGRRGEGRPRLGAGESVRVTVVAPLESVARWEAAAEREGQDRSEWIRDRLDEAAEVGR